MLSRRQRIALRAQRTVAYGNMIWFVPFFMLVLHTFGRYRCHNIAELRRQVRELAQAKPERPILICANHLTMIDSLLIIWFIYDFSSYLKDFRRFPWNVPEVQNFGRNPFLRLMCYLGKCIYVERDGSIEQKRTTVAKLSQLITMKESLCIFPEGGRSRSGRVNSESAVYGVGQLIDTHPDLRVWCLYMRGNHQETYSFFPKLGETFHISISEIEPSSPNKGRRAARDLTQQVVAQLTKMEEEYLDDRQRHRRHG